MRILAVGNAVGGVGGGRTAEGADPVYSSKTAISGLYQAYTAAIYWTYRRNIGGFGEIGMRKQATNFRTRLDPVGGGFN